MSRITKIFQTILLVTGAIILVPFIIQSCKNEENANEKIYGKVVDIKDGKEYKTIKIGTIIWLAQDYDYMDTIYTGIDTLLDEGYYTQDHAIKLAFNGWELPDLQAWSDLLKRYKNQQYELEKNGNSNLNLLFTEDKLHQFHDSYWVNEEYSCCNYPDSLMDSDAQSIRVLCRWIPTCDTIVGVEIFKDFDNNNIKFSLNNKSDKCKVRYIKRIE